MKNSIVLLAVVCAVLTLTSCSSDEEEGTLSGVTVESVLPYECDNSSNVCFCSIVTDITTIAGTHFYVGALLQGDREIFRSTPIRAITPQDETSVQLHVKVHYYDNVTAGEYSYQISRYNSYFDALEKKNRKVAATCEEKVTIDGFGLNCYENCCSNDNMEYQRWRAYATKAVADSNMIGARASILAWLDVDHCGFGATSSEKTRLSSSSAYVSVGHGTEMWVQAGIISIRFAGYTEATNKVYFEAVPGPPGFEEQYFRVLNPWQNKTRDSVTIELESSTGTWLFYMGDDPLPTDSIAIAGWVGKWGTHVSYEAEILEWETDMMGRNTDTCILANCQYETHGGGWHDAAINGSDLGTKLSSDNYSEWRLDIADQGNEVRFWDLHPLD